MVTKMIKGLGHVIQKAERAGIVWPEEEKGESYQCL